MQRFVGKWKWEDLSNSIKPVRDLTNTISGSVPLLIDLSQTDYLPGGNAMLHGMNSIRQSPRNINRVIFVIDSQLVKTFAEMVFSMMPVWRGRTQFVKTAQEGRQIID